MFHGDTLPDNPLERAASAMSKVVARIGVALHIAECQVVVEREVQILADVRGDFQARRDATADALCLEFITLQLTVLIGRHDLLYASIAASDLSATNVSC